MTDMSTAFRLLWKGDAGSIEEALGFLELAWACGSAVPRLIDKTVTPMAGARVDLEAYTFCAENKSS